MFPYVFREQGRIFFGSVSVCLSPRCIYGMPPSPERKCFMCLALLFKPGLTCWWLCLQECIQKQALSSEFSERTKRRAAINGFRNGYTPVFFISVHNRTLESALYSETSCTPQLTHWKKKSACESSIAVSNEFLVENVALPASVHHFLEATVSTSSVHLFNSSYIRWCSAAVMLQD